MASERRFFVGKLRSRYFAFLRAAQGSRNGPLAWAGVVSLAIRLVQACLWEGGECPARINAYVDDPETRRNNLVACLVLLFTALGFPLSFRKGSRGVHLTITEARVKELRDLAEEALLHNLVSKKWLKSFAGKASSFASILIFWRPFLHSIWAATCGRPQRWHSSKLCMGKAVCGGGQVDPCILERCLELGRSHEWSCATKFDEVDEKAIGIQFGDSASQQVADALAVLPGYRSGSKDFRFWRPSLTV